MKIQTWCEQAWWLGIHWSPLLISEKRWKFYNLARLQSSPESLLLAGNCFPLLPPLPCRREVKVGGKARASVTGESMFLFRGLHNGFIWLTWASILFLTNSLHMTILLGRLVLKHPFSSSVTWTSHQPDTAIQRQGGRQICGVLESQEVRSSLLVRAMKKPESRQG